MSSNWNLFVVCVVVVGSTVMLLLLIKLMKLICVKIKPTLYKMLPIAKLENALNHKDKILEERIKFQNLMRSDENQ